MVMQEAVDESAVVIGICTTDNTEITKIRNIERTLARLVNAFKRMQFRLLMKDREKIASHFSVRKARCSQRVDSVDPIGGRIRCRDLSNNQYQF